ncbi:uncharacterized protein LOC129718125 [Wyeomyia smithii]|uniref:uncharacterized protein LOC129718125 n=1 Tax=Wyeomyia smithii TaxID=174621 RepID=UPI002467FD6F|nr:uncharacterized protein LOC129718125 [Wyeomyia smithii]
MEISPFISNFQMINIQERIVLLALFEVMKLQDTMEGKLKIYRYNIDKTKLEPYLTINGIYNSVMVVIVDDKMLLITAEKESNLLVVYMVERTDCSLYQKIFFDSSIISVENPPITDKPTLQIQTGDMMIHIYKYSALEGWKLYSRDRVEQ